MTTMLKIANTTVVIVTLIAVVMLSDTADVSRRTASLADDDRDDDDVLDDDREVLGAQGTGDSGAGVSRAAHVGEGVGGGPVGVCPKFIAIGATVVMVGLGVGEGVAGALCAMPSAGTNISTWIGIK